MAYLTSDEIFERLDERFSLRAEVSDGIAEIASSALDAHVSVPSSAGADPPDALLDWVALKAYSLSLSDAAYSPGVTSESARGVSRSYSTPKASRIERMMDEILSSYRLKSRDIAYIENFA